MCKNIRSFYLMAPESRPVVDCRRCGPVEMLWKNSVDQRTFELEKAVLKKIFILVLALAVACVNRDYRFERIDGEQALTLPLKLDRFAGLRDGSSVSAEARFVDGADRVTMRI